jgi:hypothetical protein
VIDDFSWIMSGTLEDKSAIDYFLGHATEAIELIFKYFLSKESSSVDGPDESDPLSQQLLFALKSLNDHFKSKIVATPKKEIINSVNRWRCFHMRICNIKEISNF